MQKFIVPWNIAIHGLSYAKKLTEKEIKAQLIAIIDSENPMPRFPYCAEQASKHSVLARLVTSTVSFATPPLCHSDACNTQALRNESMILEVLEAEEPAVFRQELFNTLVHYYEEIQGLHGAGGRPKPKSFKHIMKSAQ